MGRLFGPACCVVGRLGRAQLSCPAQAGQPVRRGLSAQALAFLDYWVTRSSRATTRGRERAQSIQMLAAKSTTWSNSTPVAFSIASMSSVALAIEREVVSMVSSLPCGAS